MLNDLQPQKSLTKQDSVNVQTKNQKAGDLRETITTINSQNSKKKRQEEKLRQQREKANAKRQVRYDEFDVDDYINTNDGTGVVYNNDEPEIELEMVETNKSGNNHDYVQNEEEEKEEAEIVYADQNEP
eukprot:CAMPEP_0201575728 /NCGR_PEP_ID=MMETSP0190_2-20130828/21104_1 /ASSEMBLY_ACC=CAM_ASM_000263 /TAXON_ID=37353 /ORGANISM="Rosalina sp." /LENGTH=128 /DNA_ID=CAMNT_0048005707 /DNA_START=148 /DNA_END=534 /DNA_ORIENTATION=+